VHNGYVLAVNRFKGFALKFLKADRHGMDIAFDVDFETSIRLLRPRFRSLLMDCGHYCFRN
jgi:hypothetical protein